MSVSVSVSVSVSGHHGIVAGGEGEGKNGAALEREHGTVIVRENAMVLMLAVWCA